MLPLGTQRLRQVSWARPARNHVWPSQTVTGERLASASELLKPYYLEALSQLVDLDVLACDGGDLVNQSRIRHAFRHPF